MTQLTRTQYKQARRLLRAQGRKALRCMDLSTRAAMELVIDAKGEVDPLELRAAEIAIRKGYGPAPTPAQTRDEALRFKQLRAYERDRRRTALAKFDREAAMARRVEGVAA